MATTTPDTSRRDVEDFMKASDWSKAPLTNASDEQLENIAKMQRSGLEALEQRYAQPNLWKVAAAFAKPQLGGFVASLGSAADVVGENLEQQRQQQMPIAVLKAQLGQTQYLLGQNQKVTEAIDRWKREHPGQLPSADQVAEWKRMAPEAPSVKSLETQHTMQNAQQETAIKAAQAIVAAAQAKQAMGMKLSPDEQVQFDNAVRNIQNFPIAKQKLPPGGPKDSVDAADPMARQRAEGDLAGVNREIAALQKKIEKDGIGPAERSSLAILNQERNKIQERLASLGGSEGAGTVATDVTRPDVTGRTKPEETTGYYPQSLPEPDLVGQLPKRQEQILTSYAERAKKLEDSYSNIVYKEYMPVSEEPVYSQLKSETASAINFISQDPTTAKTVFNILRQQGTLFDQIKTAVNEGVSSDGLLGHIRLPVKEFSRAGLTEGQQAYADNMVKALLTVGMARLQAQGIDPRNGADAYAKALLTKASLDETAPSALKTLMNDQISLETNKQIYDLVLEESRSGKTHPNSPTPMADIFQHSKEIKRIKAEAERRRKEVSDQFSAYLESTKKKPQGKQ